MKIDGFAMEDYNMTDTCAFWGAAGFNAPTLRRLAFCLCALPCSSGEAERNWQEVKENMTKNRNKLARDKMHRKDGVRESDCPTESLHTAQTKTVQKFTR